MNSVVTSGGSGGYRSIVFTDRGDYYEMKYTGEVTASPVYSAYTIVTYTDKILDKKYKNISCTPSVNNINIIESLIDEQNKMIKLSFQFTSNLQIQASSAYDQSGYVNLFKFDPSINIGTAGPYDDIKSYVYKLFEAKNYRNSKYNIVFTIYDNCLIAHSTTSDLSEIRSGQIISAEFCYDYLNYVQ